MSLYVLDSDIFTMFQRLHGRVMARVAAARKSNQVAVSVITIDESFRGWHARILKSRKHQELSDAYAGLALSAGMVGEFSILPFPVPAIQRFEALKRLKVGGGPNDLRIAAIALEAGAIVVTHNLSDFRPIPGLVCEDWSV